MFDNQIIDIFYNKIVLEAQKGRIDCYFAINIAFNLVVENRVVSHCQVPSSDGLLIPTLKISNQEQFNQLLVQYVKRATNFYPAKNFAFLNDIDTLNIKNATALKEEYLIKYVISTLFANASFSDFDDPIAFLKSRIAMFDNPILKTTEATHLGYLDTIKANIYIQEEKSPIKSETPYRLTGHLQFDDGYILDFPEIYLGNDQDKYILYGIQKTKPVDEITERPYLKQIRKGLIAKLNGAPEHYFLAVAVLLSLCNDQDIKIVPFLVERWNAKRIAMHNKVKRNSSLSLSDLEENQEKIQENITQILLRYFTKIMDTSEGLEFIAWPFEIDSNAYLRINKPFISRCPVFNELNDLIATYKSLDFQEKPHL